MAAGKVKRARTVLCSNQGYTCTEITQKLEMGERTVRWWVTRFNKLGIPGPEEEQRPGRPRVFTAEQVGAVIETALTKPDELGLPFGAWTLARLVAHLSKEKGVEMSRSRISEIFRREGLRTGDRLKRSRVVPLPLAAVGGNLWRQQESWFDKRVDPEFAKKRVPPYGFIRHPRQKASSSA